MIAIAEGLIVCNDYCHKCRKPGLLEYTGTIDKLERAHMRCKVCNGKEYRKPYKQQGEQGPDLYRLAGDGR
jgi:Zn-finger nucleic acid-binding protein